MAALPPPSRASPAPAPARRRMRAVLAACCDAARRPRRRRWPLGRVAPTSPRAASRTWSGRRRSGCTCRAIGTSPMRPSLRTTPPPPPTRSARASRWRHPTPMPSLTRGTPGIIHVSRRGGGGVAARAELLFRAETSAGRAESCSRMGCGASSTAAAPRQLVLLGGGECGKTTIFKQIQMIHGAGFKDKEAEWIDAIHRSPVRTVKTLCTAVENAHAELSPENKARRAGAARACAARSPARSRRRCAPLRAAAPVAPLAHTRRRFARLRRRTRSTSSRTTRTG